METSAASRVDSSLYRMMVRPKDLVSAIVRMKQTDMLVSGTCYLGEEALSLVKECRRQIESYIRSYPIFGRSLEPVPDDASAPEIVQCMIVSSRKSNVGPMAAVAGAVADYVGNGLMLFSRDIIVENGGDVFIQTSMRREIMILSESSSVGRVKIAIRPSAKSFGVCTSSGRLGHSLSFGRADAVTVIAATACMADAAATAIGNCIRSGADIAHGIELAQNIGVHGVLIIACDQLGLWGDIEICH